MAALEGYDEEILSYKVIYSIIKYIYVARK